MAPGGSDGELPAGCTMEISYASTDNPMPVAEAQRLSRIRQCPQTSDRSGCAMSSANGRRLRSMARGRAAAEPVSVAAPIFDVRGRYLWISIALIASSGAGIPAVFRACGALSRKLADGEPAWHLPAGRGGTRTAFSVRWSAFWKQRRRRWMRRSPVWAGM